MDKPRVDLIFQVALCVDNMEAALENWKKIFQLDESTIVCKCTRDAYENEVKYYHDSIVNGTTPKNDNSDAMADLKLFRDICMKIKE